MAQFWILISPFELPLRSGVFIAKPRPFDGGFGVFDDCLPDGWGLLILDRYLPQKGGNPRTLTISDRLALAGSTGRGALEFRPDNNVVTRQDYADFEKLALEAEQILDSDDYTGEGIEEFQDHGTYQFTAIDDCTRLKTIRIYPNKKAESTIHFLGEILNTFPFPIQRIQTDWGTEFFNYDFQYELHDHFIKFRSI